MSTASNKTFIRRYVDALSGKAKTPALLSQFIADDALTQHIMTMEAAFPRYEIVPDDMIAEDDKVVLRATFRATHAGEFAGVTPSQRGVTQPFIIIYRVRDEKIVDHWLAVDMLGLMQQLGAAPEPASAPR